MVLMSSLSADFTVGIFGLNFREKNLKAPKKQ